MNTLSRTPHLKLQEMCDCYLETDFSRQLKVMVSSQSTDLMEDGFKYLALVLLEAITEKASALVLRKENNRVKVTLKGAAQKELPSPTPEIMSAIITIMRDILHLDEGKGQSPATLGLKNNRLDLSVRMKKGDDEESLAIEFPELEKKTFAVRKPVEPAMGKPEEGQTHWKCGKCSFTFTAPGPPGRCPGCGETCDFLNITCYTPECGGPGNIDARFR